MENNSQNGSGSDAGVNAGDTRSLKGVVVTTKVLVAQAVLMIAISFFILWVVDLISHGHHVHNLLQALVPTGAAIKWGFLASVPFFVGGELCWVLRHKIGATGESSENYLKKTGLLGSFVNSLATGIPEEVLFRGVLQTFVGAWFSSIVFGLMHCTGRRSWTYVIETFLMGLALAYVFTATGSLWAGIIIHVVNNFLSFTTAKRFRALFGVKTKDGTFLAN